MIFCHNSSTVMSISISVYICLTVMNTTDHQETKEQESEPEEETCLSESTFFFNLYHLILLEMNSRMQSY